MLIKDTVEVISNHLTIEDFHLIQALQKCVFFYNLILDYDREFYEWEITMDSDASDKEAFYGDVELTLDPKINQTLPISVLDDTDTDHLLVVVEFEIFPFLGKIATHLRKNSRLHWTYNAGLSNIRLERGLQKIKIMSD